MIKRLKTTPLLAASAALLLVIPTLVFVASGLIRGMNLSSVVSALTEQFLADKTNLFVVSLLGLVPLMLTALLLGVRKLIRKTWDGSVAYAWGGVLPAVAVAIFVNMEYWPKYLPARQFLGFPHGLEFVIGPFVFAPIGVLLGFLVVWFLRKQQ